MTTIVAFIRGINLGPAKRVGMAELRSLLAELGYRNPRTLLASGNVVVETEKTPEEVAGALAAGIRERFGHDVKVIARTAEELAAVVEANPLAAMAADGSKYMVLFLSQAPAAELLKELSAEDFAPEAFAARGREIYAWCPHGMRDSRLMKALSERRLGVTVTVRNWNTVLKTHAASQVSR